MNKVDQANTALYSLVSTVCAEQGLPLTAIVRNALHSLDEEDGADEGASSQRTLRILAEFKDGSPRTEAVSLSPTRYELNVGATLTLLAFGEEATGRAARLRIIEAIALALDADPTIGGATSYAEIGDDPDDGQDEDDGAEMRGDILTIEMLVVDALTARG
jgi:hypothetical protein